MGAKSSHFAIMTKSRLSLVYYSIVLKLATIMLFLNLTLTTTYFDVFML